MRRGYASRAQAVAHREIKRLQHERHMLATYGMLPIAARHPGRCGCGRHPDSHFRPGDKIVKFRGAWWLIYCVDDVRQAEFRATCRYVLEWQTSRGEWVANAWTNDPEEAARWRRNCEDSAAIAQTYGFDAERLVDRQEAH